MFFKEGVNIWVNNDCPNDYGAYLISSIIIKVTPSGVTDLERGEIAGLYIYAGNAIDDDDIIIDSEMARPLYKSTYEPIDTLLWLEVISSGGHIQKDGYAMSIGFISRSNMSAEFIEAYSGAQVHVIATCYSGEFVQFHGIQMPEIGDV